MLIQETRNYFKKKKSFFSGMVRAGERIKYCITFQIPFSVNLLLRVLHMNLGSYDRISAFRKGHFTTTALMGVRDDIRYAMKRKEVTLMVLADFSKAFDTISFSATIVKFYKLGSQNPFSSGS